LGGHVRAETQFASALTDVDLKQAEAQPFGRDLQVTVGEVFDNHYTGSGYTCQEKEYHYNRQVEPSRDYVAGSDATSDCRPWNP
jgi:hypothetical protein